jgi:kumamolisin
MNAAINDSLGTGYRPCVLSFSVAWHEYVGPGAGGQFGGWDEVINAAVAKGITIVAASGDWGPELAASGQNTVCWPASNPYVLAVGGTSVNPVQDANGEYTSISSEVTWNDGEWYTVTGGGISQVYNVPAYQNGLTYTTFTKSSPTSLTGTLGTPVTLTTNAFNNDLNHGPLLGRAVPDIALVADAANGCDIYTCYSAQLPNLQFPSNGTSAAAPAIAGLIARINQQRVTPVGYVNDIFYRNPNCFNDITVGNNSIQANVDLTGGYQTTIGYDACTGLGSPKGDALMTLFSSGTKVLTANGWSALTGIFVNVNGTWAPPVAIYTNVNGTWGPF